MRLLSMRLLSILASLSSACGSGVVGASDSPTQNDAATTLGSDASGSDPSDAAVAKALQIAVISDLNGPYGSTSYGSAVSGAIDRLLASSPDLVIATGDLVAGQMAGLNYSGMWSGFHAAVTDRLSEANIAFAVTPGNHDGSAYGSFEGERAIFVSQWQDRRPNVPFLSDENYPLRYSFQLGSTLFVSLDDTTIGALSAEQMSWLASELDRPADVKIVFGHVPLYPFSQGRETEIIGDPALQELFESKGVDLFISGHHHAFYPGKRSSVRHLSMACLGSGPRALIGTGQVSPQSFVMLEVEAGTIAGLDALGGPDFDETVARATLPESVGEVTRDDL